MTVTKQHFSHKMQAGVITLTVSLSILMLSTLVVLSVSRVMLMEQRITINETRAKEAFAAAEAGMMEAMAYLEHDPDVNGDHVIDPVFDSNDDGLGDASTTALVMGSVHVKTCDLSKPGCGSGGEMTSIRVISSGVSRDGSTSRSLSFIMTIINPLAAVPAIPLIVRGSVALGGSAYIENLEGHSTVWSGADVSLTGNDVTAVPDVSDSGYPACMDIPRACEPAEASGNGLKGLDVVEQDTTLAGMTAETLFMQFFSRSTTSFRPSMVTVDTNSSSLPGVANGALHEVIWVEGDADIQNLVIGCVDDPPGPSPCEPKDMRPCILVVNGDAVFRGNNTLVGFIFVLGGIEIAGDTVVSGAIATGAGLAATAGSLDIHYDSGALAGSSRAGVTALIAGSWKDH